MGMRALSLFSEIASQKSDHKGGEKMSQVARAPRLPSRSAPSMHLLPRQSATVWPQAFERSAFTLA